MIAWRENDAARKVLFAKSERFLDYSEVREELKSILKEAYARERRLNFLYCALVELDESHDTDPFFVKAREDQTGNIQVILAINQKYGNEDIDPGVFEKLGDSLVNRRAGRCDRIDLLRQLLERENELIDLYKQSLPHLSSDDETRKLVNKILTVKLGHRRELMDKLEMFVAPGEQ